MGLRDELLHDAILALVLGGAGYLIYRRYMSGASQFHAVATGVESRVRSALTPNPQSSRVKSKLKAEGYTPGSYMSQADQADAAAKALVVAPERPKGYISTAQQQAAALAYLDARRKAEAAKAAAAPATKTA